MPFDLGHDAARHVPAFRLIGMDVVVTYVDGEGKSGQYYASRYAEENSLGRRCVISPVAFSKTLQAYVTKNGNPTVVTIIDDIIATGQSLVKNLASFVDENGPILRKLNVPLIIIALAATADGEAYVRTEIRKIDWLDFDLRVCDPLSERDFAFSKTVSGEILMNWSEQKRCVRTSVHLFIGTIHWATAVKGCLWYFPIPARIIPFRSFILVRTPRR
jgi:hypothetical protein